MFPAVPKNESFPDRELAVLQFWKERGIYHKSLAAREGAPSFVFYEGPPTANGKPHPGHCLTRAVKDLFPRYKTMRGYHCERKAGWDTHGLPVETEVSKELGIHSKEEIERYGIEPFIQLCQKSVWRYMRQWERLTERIGFWVDLDAAYVTYHQSYVESVWWSLKELFNRGLLYKGHKIVWWWAQGGTALSAGEVGQGYREVADPSVYVKFPLLDEHGSVTDTSLLVWTTTPWTLPSNQFAAINSALEYSVVLENDSDTSGKLIVASALLDLIRNKSKRELKVVGTLRGLDLIGRRFVPPFDFFYLQEGNKKATLVRDLKQHSVDQVTRVAMRASYYLEQGFNTKQASKLLEKTEEYVGWRIVGARFVTTDSGTGIVHIAPAFGEDDFRVFVNESLTFACDDVAQFPNPVQPNGKFGGYFGHFAGRDVHDCNKDINRELKERELLFHQEQYVHDYPFCWRAEEDRLIQYPRESWFIRTTAFKDAMLANNAKINWLPEHIRDGRFGNFLESNVDWALSRERFWGTPLPIWACDQCGHMEAVESYDKLLAKPGAAGGKVWAAAKAANPELPEDLKVHKPYIDAITYPCTKCSSDPPPWQGGARGGTADASISSSAKHEASAASPSPVPTLPGRGGTMRRVTEVIDCWYDSGAMPFAQWGYAGEPEGVSPRSALQTAAKKFASQFPADFISEAIDQTRGWFYSQLAISTMLWGESRVASRESREAEKTRNSQLATRSVPFPHPFRNCIVLGLMLGEDGQKMAKSKRNYREPSEIFDRYGADALRWYFFANQPPWTSIRYSEQAIKDSIPEFLLRLWNVYSFFTIYANIDEFDPATEASESGKRKAESGSDGPLSACLFASSPSYRAVRERNELDRWILSELHRTAAAVVERMDQYDNFAACTAITEFVDALSNWYVRRSRDRFWAADKRAPDKLDAYWTLYECLLTTAQLIAPFTPFLAESLWQNLAAIPFGAHAAGRVAESVHLCDYPAGDPAAVDEQLSEQMRLVRLIASLGRAARTAAALKVRQPLARVEVILADVAHRAWIGEHAAVIAEELNVKQVEFSDEPDKYVTYEVLPNFKLLGPKLGKLMPKVKPALANQSGAKLLANIRDNGMIDLVIDGQAVALAPEDVEIRLQAKPGWAAANDKGVVVVLATELTPELVAEGLARDLVRVIQDRRKELGCEFTDRIEVGVESSSTDVRAAIEGFRNYIAGETLADKIVPSSLAEVEAVDAKLGDAALKLYIRTTP